MMPQFLRLFKYGLLCLLGAFGQQQVWGQCLTQVLHTTGTQQVGCTSVTVTSEGATGFLSYCGESPHWVGVGTEGGSYTFSFSPPVSAVSLGITAINNQPVFFSREEVRFEIDGVPYPITVPGTPPIDCFTSAVITSTGAITGEVDGVGAWDVMEINTTISTLKVEDVIFEGVPNGVIFSLYICSPCCETDAGTMQAQTLQACVNEPAVFNHNGDEVLDNNDVLQFLLFSNLNDTLGSTIAVGNTPVFDFNPATMETETTYYVAAVAGNNVGGNVDPNDPCLDFSNASMVIWHPVPVVVLAADAGDLCAGDCRTVTAAFTGTAPFTLTYTAPGGGSATQTFPGNSGVFHVCVPSNAPAGGFTIQVTSLLDAFCSCTW